MSHQISQPLRIVHVRFTAGHVLHMRRIGQHHHEIIVGQDMPDRFPVHASGLHGDVRNALVGQPNRQLHQLLGRGLEGTHLGANLAPGHVACAGHYRVLVPHPDQRNADRELPSRLLPMRPAWNPVRGNLISVLPGGDTVRGISGGAQGFRVRLKNGLQSTKGKIDLCACRIATL
jgi:hypothetical protein